MTYRKGLFVGAVAMGLLSSAMNARALEQPTILDTVMSVEGNKVMDLDSAGHNRNDCGAPINEGVLNSAGSLIVNDNTAGGDDFDGVDALCAGSGYGAGNAGEDNIHEFTVDVCGVWSFTTCASIGGSPTGGNMCGTCDTSLQLTDGTAGCPGTVVACNGDIGGGSPTFCSRVSSFLTTGTTYYLVVDSYASGYEGAYTVSAVNATPCCTVDADCDDGVFCNGTETCNVGTGECLTGAVPCTIIQTCDEANDVCIDPDPCLAAKNGAVSSGFFSPTTSNPGCYNALIADEIQLRAGAGRDVVSYEIPIIARAGCAAPFPACAVGDPYTLEMSMWEADPAGTGLPLAEIVGCRCTGLPGTLLVGGSPAVVFTCTPAPGACTIPAGDPNTGIDVFIGFRASNGRVGFSIPSNEQTIGGPGLDDDFPPAGAFVLEGCTAAGGAPTGILGLAAFAPPTINDMLDARICTTPVGACCDGAGGCSVVTEADCLGAGGTYLGDDEIGSPSTCDSPDGDSDGVRDECDLCPADGNKTAPGQCGCGNADTDTDMDGTADCNDGCPTDPGKIAPGQCGCGVPDDDADLDGTADCNDGCPNDPNKLDPGVCGCGVAETGDTDGDGYLDCVDQCPGVDDDVFFPGCQGAIPTVSEWGMIVLALLLLVAGKVYFGRRVAMA
jgi:hypothetical protein